MKVSYYVDLYPNWHLQAGWVPIPSAYVSTRHVPQGSKRVKITVDLPEFGGETDTAIAEASVEE
jgi:hypothetical protein